MPNITPAGAGGQPREVGTRRIVALKASLYAFEIVRASEHKKNRAAVHELQTAHTLHMPEPLPTTRAATSSSADTASVCWLLLRTPLRTLECSVMCASNSEAVHVNVHVAFTARLRARR